MKKYWRELGETYTAMPAAVRFTFTLMTFLPGLLLLPVLFFLANLSKIIVAQATLFMALRSNTKLDPVALNALSSDLFSSSPATGFLILSIIALIIIGSVSWMLMQFAGIHAKRAAKASTEEGSAQTTA